MMKKLSLMSGILGMLAFLMASPSGAQQQAPPAAPAAPAIPAAPKGEGQALRPGGLVAGGSFGRSRLRMALVGHWPRRRPACGS